MDEINKLRLFNQLKSINRINSVSNRKESSAEHSWSCLILADYFLSKFNLQINRLKVYELLMYHDVVEIEAGDTPLGPELKLSGKKEKEDKAAKFLQKKLPKPLNDKFLGLFNEFEEQKTVEARFTKAIDALDAIVHELSYKKDWQGWTEKFLVEKKLHLFEEFPEIKATFKTILKFMKKEKYLND